MDMNQIRVNALRRVMGELSQAEFADLHDISASYLSQIMGGHRSFGERAASNMEKKIGLTPGALSRPEHSGAESAQGYQIERNQIAQEMASYGVTESPEMRKLIRTAAALDDSQLKLLCGIADVIRKER